jgi:hypothetical protein
MERLLEWAARASMSLSLLMAFLFICSLPGCPTPTPAVPRYCLGSCRQPSGMGFPACPPAAPIDGYCGQGIHERPCDNGDPRSACRAIRAVCYCGVQ